MLTSRSIVAAAALGLLGGALCALWARVSDSQGSPPDPGPVAGRQAPAPAAGGSLASR